jgi:hypothetical protein
MAPCILVYIYIYTIRSSISRTFSRYSILTMAASGFSETSVIIYQTTRRYISGNLQIDKIQNLSSPKSSDVINRNVIMSRQPFVGPWAFASVPDPILSRTAHATHLYPQKLAVTSPTSGGRSVGIVRSRTKAAELVSYTVSRTPQTWDQPVARHRTT